MKYATHRHGFPHFGGNTIKRRGAPLLDQGTVCGRADSGDPHAPEAQLWGAWLDRDIGRLVMSGIRVTDNAGDSIGAYLAWNGERIGLAWSDSRSGTYDIYFQSFDATLTPLTPEQRLTRTISLP